MAICVCCLKDVDEQEYFANDFAHDDCDRNETYPRASKDQFGFRPVDRLADGRTNQIGDGDAR